MAQTEIYTTIRVILMKENHELVLHREALKDLVMKSFRVMQTMKKRLGEYRLKPTADQSEADKRQKELDTLQTTIEEAIFYIKESEKEMLKRFSEIEEIRKNAKFFHEAWQKNISENIDLTNFVNKKLQKKCLILRNSPPIY